MKNSIIIEDGNVKHFGDNSNPDPRERFIADEGSFTFDDDKDAHESLKDADTGAKQAAEKKPLRTSSSAWDAAVVPE